MQHIDVALERDQRHRRRPEQHAAGKGAGHPAVAVGEGLDMEDGVVQPSGLRRWVHSRELRAGGELHQPSHLRADEGDGGGRQPATVVEADVVGMVLVVAGGHHVVLHVAFDDHLMGQLGPACHVVDATDGGLGHAGIACQFQGVEVGPDVGPGLLVQ